MPDASISQSLARLQRLCSLGIDSRVVVPVLLRLLHGLVGSDSSDFFWATPDLRLADSYLEELASPSVIEYYLTRWHNKAERTYKRTFSEVMATPYVDPVADFHGRTLKTPWAEFLRSEAYDAFYRPLHYYHRLQLKVTEDGRGRAALHLNRPEHAPDFNAREHRLLASIGPFVAHALAPAGLDVPMAEAEVGALIFATGDGRIEYQSPAAKRTLLRLSHPEWSPDTDWHDGSPGFLPPPLRRLCRLLASTFQGHVVAAPPVWKHRNPWGAFAVRAYPLVREAEPGPRWLVGLTIERSVPLAVRLIERMEHLPLSGREIDVCLGVAAGHSRGQIAQRLGISEHTVITHTRRIHAKLDVHSRRELLARLRAL